MTDASHDPGSEGPSSSPDQSDALVAAEAPATTNVASLEFMKVIRTEANRLVTARDAALEMHHGGDIDAAGHEVESKVRDVLDRLLPSSYYVGHGHIVDKEWHLSPQIDVIIADRTWSPVVFTAENGTQYFPFESVYAIGEVKSTFSGPNQIAEWTQKIAKVRNGLIREPTPPNYLGNGLSLGNDLRIDEERPYRNPLFTFILFVDSGEAFAPESLRSVYLDTPIPLLPTIACLLNRGVCLRAVLSTTDGHASLDEFVAHPEYENPPEPSRHWTWLEMSDDPDPRSHSMTLLYAMLLSHGSSCILKRIEPGDYFSRLVHWTQGVAFRAGDNESTD